MSTDATRIGPAAAPLPLCGAFPARARAAAGLVRAVRVHVAHQPIRACTGPIAGPSGSGGTLCTRARGQCVTGARAASAAHVRRRAAGATEVTRTDTQATGEAARRRGLPARFVTTCFCSVMAGQPGGGVPVAGSMLEFCSGFHCRIGGIRGDPAGGILLDPPDSHWPGDPLRRCRFNSPRQPTPRTTVGVAAPPPR
jgi:hypothetical protein